MQDFADFLLSSALRQPSDLAICNYEGTLGGPPYSGFPNFSAPDEIADALKWAGFDLIGTANNHCIDRGFTGLLRTSAVFNERGLTVVGSRQDLTMPTDSLVDLDGIKVGMLCYTFETIGTDSQKTINGIPLPSGADPYIDSFNPYRKDTYEQDLSDILLRVDKLKDQGADIICLSVHWGEEYMTQSVTWQRDMAQRLCDGGVDVIFGHHPHVLEEINVLTSAVTGKETIVFYSLGNLLSNMNYGTLGTFGKAQDSAIARVTIHLENDVVTLEKGEYIPTYVVRVTDGGILHHYVVPVLEAMSSPDAYLTTLTEMESSYERIRKVLGPCTGSDTLPIYEASC